VHAPYLERWHASNSIGGIFIRQGWEEISARVKRQFGDRAFYSPRHAHETRVENLQLHLSAGTAWATFEQHYPGPAPTLSEAPTVTRGAVL
jgi:hypothetical protein